MATGLGIAAFILAVVIVVDPYDTLILSPPLDRAPVVTNQRFSYPGLARKAKFDSAIIGTSTARLLNPSQLNRLFDARFVNLAMNSARAYEQAQIFNVFVRHHPRPRVVLFAIDSEWCGRGDRYVKFTPRPFPAWLYDEDPWNDFLHLFDLKTLERTGLQFAYLTGIHPTPRRGLDGYTNFLPDQSEYDLARARRNVYRGPEPKVHPAVVPPENPPTAVRAAWKFPTHVLFEDMIRQLPAETLKIVMFVPYHAYFLSPRGSLAEVEWRECKVRFVAMTEHAANAHVLDFMFRSDITTRDENYWDGLHYTLDVAERIGRLIADGVRERRGQPRLFRYLSAGAGVLR